MCFVSNMKRTIIVTDKKHQYRKRLLMFVLMLFLIAIAISLYYILTRYQSNQSDTITTTDHTNTTANTPKSWWQQARPYIPGFVGICFVVAAVVLFRPKKHYKPYSPHFKPEFYKIISSWDYELNKNTPLDQQMEQMRVYVKRGAELEKSHSRAQLEGLIDLYEQSYLHDKVFNKRETENILSYYTALELKRFKATGHT